MQVRRWIEEGGGRRLPVLLLGVAVLAAGALYVALDSQLTFVADDWGMLLRRQSWELGTFLDPYEEHFILGPALAFKLLQELFGMGSALPYFLFSIGLYLLGAVLLFVFLRRRVGDWAALIGAVLILFLGAAFEDLLWISPFNFSGSVAAGLGMLLALDREDGKGDRIACALLAVSIAFSSVGLAFAAGALVDLVWGKRPRWRRAYVAVAPLALFALWWLGWGREAEKKASLGSVGDLPGFVFDAMGAGFTSLLGLATGDGSEASQPHLIWGQLVLVAATALVVVRVVQLRRVPRGLAVALAIGFAFWVLIGLLPNLSATPEHAPTSSRYQLMSAVFLLLILAEALRGVRIPVPVLAIAGAVTIFAVSGGISLLQREHEERWEPFADSTRYSLAAVEIAGPSIEPTFEVAFPPTLSVDAETYLDTVERYGSPAYDEDELAGGTPSGRFAADVTIAQALGLALRTPQAGARTLRCQRLRAQPDGVTGVTLLHGGFTLDNQGGEAVEVLLGRFSDGLSVGLGPVPAGVETELVIPVDASTRPWRLGLRGSGPVRLCTTEPA
jgi:hypothetical protein